MADEGRVGTQGETQVQEETEEDNGFLDPADTDVDVEDSDSKEDDLSASEKLSKLSGAMRKQPLNREILYEILVYCQDEHPLHDVEEHVAAHPAFVRATQNQYHMVTMLTKNFGLERIERDEAGEKVTPDRKVGLSEDELDDLIATVSYVTTDVGRQLVEDQNPFNRISGLMTANPERIDLYTEVLDFIGEQPRSYPEIQSLLRGRPELHVVIDGTPETMQPSVFVDKLERAGALVWDGKWKLSEEGREFLKDFKAE